MKAYAERHYGIPSATITPSRIVLHFSETDSATSVVEHFEASEPVLGETPGVCAHFVVDQDGTILRLVPETTMCRHVIGLNDRAIGIEIVQSSAGHSPRWAADQILARTPQRDALLALIRWLQATHGITATAVIGHAMANDDPAFHDLLGWRNDHTDWAAPEVAELRRLL